MKTQLAIFITIFFFVSCNNPSLYKKEAKKYFREKNYELSLVEINKAIEAEPDSISNYVLRWQIFDLTGKYKEEITDLNKIIELNSKVKNKSLYSHYQRSIAQLQLGFYNEALIDINYFIDNGGNAFSLTEAYINKASILYKMNDFKNSEKFYNLAISENNGKDKSIESQALIGLAYLTKSLNESLRLLDKAILIDDKNATAYNSRATIYMTLNKIDLAYNDLVKAIHLSNPNEKNIATLYYNLGQIYMNYKNNEDSAAKYYEKAIHLSPQSPDNGLIYTNLAIIKHHAGKMELALKDFEKAEAINPQNDILLYNFSLLLNDLKRNSEALEKINKAIAINPKDADYHDTKGTICMDLASINEAIAEYEKAIKINPNSGRTYYNLGYLYGDTKKSDQSIKYYDKAILLNYDLKSSLVNRALEKRKIKNISGACADLKKAYNLGRTDTKSLIDELCN